MFKTIRHSFKKTTLTLFFAVFVLALSSADVSAACPGSLNKSLQTVVGGDTCTVPSSNTYRIDVATGENSTTGSNALTLSGGTLTVNNTGTLRVGGNLTLSGGSLSVQAGGALNLGASWISDGDADNWATGFAAGNLFTATASGRRRLGLMSSTSTADCNDAAFSLTNTCYSYSQSTYYTYAQSTYYTYAQSAYYGYSQSMYYSYSQGVYYGYGQSAYYGYGQSYYSSCFAPGTQVLMADGSHKNIEDVQSGDMVQSYNVTTGAASSEKVAKLLKHPNIPGGYLVINDTLKVTGNHLVWSYDRQMWVRAETLEVGDKLMAPDGSAIVITSISSVAGANTVYNLSLQGPNHNYFAENTLVHNWKL